VPGWSSSWGGGDIERLQELPVDELRQASRMLSGSISPPGQVHTPANPGMLAYHSAELPYLFGHLIAAERYDDVNAQVPDAIEHAWTEFARTGVPSSQGPGKVVDQQASLRQVASHVQLVPRRVRGEGRA
jgi:carboxylesterase type B